MKNKYIFISYALFFHNKPAISYVGTVLDEFWVWYFSTIYVPWHIKLVCRLDTENPLKADETQTFPGTPASDIFQQLFLHLTIASLAVNPQYIFILHCLQIAWASHKRSNLKVLLDEVLLTASSTEWLTHFRCGPIEKTWHIYCTESGI